MLFGLVLPLLTWGPAVDAQETTTSIQALKLALKAGGTILPRFHLRDGRSLIGRVIEFKDDAMTIRRPSGGLRSILIADIRSLEIVNPRGERIRGQLTVLADGTYGWQLDSSPGGANQTAAATPPGVIATEAGGPLVKLPPGGTGDAPTHETAVLDVEAKPAVDPGLTQNIAIDPNPMTTTPSPATTDGGAEPLGILQLSVSADVASETENVMFFRLKLSEPARQSIVIIYTVLNGSAIAVDDFKQRQGVVVFDPGQQQAALAIEIIDDDAVESTEFFELFVTGDPNTVIIDDRTIEAIIHDNDA